TEAAQGRWTPPPTPEPPAPPPPTRVETIVDPIIRFRPGNVPVGVLALIVSGLATVALPFAIYRSVKRRENFWLAWLKVTFWIAVQLLSSSGRTYSSGSSSGASSSGGGGRFGGGGASGGW